MPIRFLRAILILPGTVLVLIPGLLVWLTRGTALAAAPAGVVEWRAWLGSLLVAAGLALGIWTGRLFARVGLGTPAPWDPPQRLVIEGPYRHVRNPMISGVLLMLGGVALLLGSWPIAAWFAVFFTGNAIYFPLSEEKALRRRFGADYERYARHVPRWLPRLTPWRPDVPSR